MIAGEPCGQELIEAVHRVTEVLKNELFPVTPAINDDYPIIEAIRLVASAQKNLTNEPLQSITLLVPLPDAVTVAVSSVAALVRDSLAELESVRTDGDAEIAAKVRFAIEDVVSIIPKRRILSIGQNRNPSILRMARRQADENLHSDLLGTLLDSDRVGPIAFSLFNSLVHCAFGVESKTKEVYQFAKREVQLGALAAAELRVALRRIDLLVLRPSCVLVIENKIWSSESSGQTEDYARTIAASYPNKAQYCVLLSPFGTEPVCSSFRGISYRHLYDALVHCSSEIAEGLPPIAAFYLAELEDLMRDFY